MKTRLDSRDLITNEVSTNSKNRHGEFTMMNPMTFINEVNLFRCNFQSKKAEAIGVLNITDEDKTFSTLIGDWLTQAQVLFFSMINTA